MFLLSLIDGEYDRTGDNGLAVADGLSATARVITAAAGSRRPGPVGEAEHRQPLGAQAEVEGHLAAGAGQAALVERAAVRDAVLGDHGFEPWNSESMVTDRGSPGSDWPDGVSRSTASSRITSTAVGSPPRTATTCSTVTLLP